MSTQQVPATDFVPFTPTNFRPDVASAQLNLFLHARDTSNLGDLKSTPFDCFTLRGERVVDDFWSTVNVGENRFDNIIVGVGYFRRITCEYPRSSPRSAALAGRSGLRQVGTVGAEHATKREGRYRCGSKECRADFTVMTGTVMEASHIKLTVWLMAST
jgi:hypothetical protein